MAAWDNLCVFSTSGTDAGFGRPVAQPSRQPFVAIAISEQMAINRPNGPFPAVAIAEAIAVGQAAERSGMVVHADRLAGKFLGHVRRNIVLQ